MDPQSINDCTNATHNKMISYIDTLYDHLINDLTSQKDFLHTKLHKKLQDSKSKHQNTNGSDTIYNTNDDKRSLANIYQMHDKTTLNMKEILQDKSSLQCMHEISKVTYSMIKAQIQQKCNDINKNNAIVQIISDDIDQKSSNNHKVNITDIHESNIDQYGLDSSYNFDSILSQFSSDHIICLYDNVKLYYYQQKKWNPVGYNRGRLELSHIKSSNLQYLSFSNIGSNQIYSFQPIDITNCDIKPQQQHPCCVNWVASDWCKQGKHYPFCAIFENNNHVMSFVDYCNQTKIDDDDSKQANFVETSPTIGQHVSSSVKMNSLSEELALKKVYKWNIEQEKWIIVCKKSTLQFYKENNNDKNMILIKDNNCTMINHIVPNANSANLKMQNEKWICEWTTETEDIIQKEPLRLFVYFKTQKSFNSFVELFTPMLT
eukprot:240692_1